METFLVLDGNSILNRAFYGIRGLSNAAGFPTGAIYGFLNILRKHMDALQPAYLACAFDTHKPTFRHETFAGYKGNRQSMPEELALQLPYAKKVAKALGFTVVECPGYEADDILGTLHHYADQQGDILTYLLTGDRDSLQLITDNTHVMLMRNKEDVDFTKERFVQEYGITPAEFIDVKALMGDSSDAIPGVAGIGEKTAVKLIAKYHTLENLYADEEYNFASTPSIAAKLRVGKEAAYLSRHLATICQEAPIPTDIASYRAEQWDTETLLSLFRELSFTDMAKKFGMETAPEKIESTALPTVPAQTELLAEEAFPPFDVPPVLVLEQSQMALYDGKRLLTCEASPARIQKILEQPYRCFDHKALLHASGCMQENGRLPVTDACCFDGMLAAYLLEPGRSSYPLEKVAAQFELTLPETVSVAEKAVAISVICQKAEKMLSECGMLSLLTDIEIPLSGVLASMESAGFKVDTGGIMQYANQLKETEEALTQAIWMIAGHDFNLNSPKQLGEVLFEEIGLPAGRKTKTGYSTDAETLEKLRPYHPIIENILSYRQITKLRGTYGEPLARLADARQRIHTQFNQTGTATGRLSSNDPNLQNIPVRMELGREIRKYFIPENSNYILLDADYSQIELRLLSHMADDKVMQEAFLSGEDIHTKVASQVFGVSPEAVTPELRRRAKAVNFGIIYGIGDYSLSQDLHISRKQAGQYIDDYLHTYPNVDMYLKKTVAEARKNGYTTTLFGRRRNIPELSSKNRNIAAFGERVAMNSPIQGTAADIIKIAMIHVQQALIESGIDARLIMQVHDELIVETAKSCAGKAKEILVREMENAVQLAVPLTAEVGEGKNWYEAKEA